MKRNLLYRSVFLCLILCLILPGLAACAGTAAAQTAEQTLNGYIMDEHCFIKKPVPASDSKKCLQMPACAATGYGIAVLQDDGKYKFYFLDGAFAPDATGAQLLAIDLVNETVKNDHISITVVGKLTGATQKASDGEVFPVINVSSLVESN